MSAAQVKLLLKKLAEGKSLVGASMVGGKKKATGKSLVGGASKCKRRRHQTAEEKQAKKAGARKSPWVQWVKAWAAKYHDGSYGAALQDPDCRTAYHEQKNPSRPKSVIIPDGGKRKRTAKKNK